MSRTWKIRDQKPDGSWGDEREVTLAQYKAEIAARAEHARRIHAQNVDALRVQS